MRERQAGLEHEVRMLAEVVVGGGLAGLDGAVLHRVGNLQARDDFAGGERRGSGTCCPTSRRSSLANSSDPPYSVSRDLGKLDVRRHFTSGMLCAMAGAATVEATATPAAPTPAVLINFLRCIDLYPPYRMPTWPPWRRNTGTRNSVWKADFSRKSGKKKPRRSGVSLDSTAFSDQTLPAPYIRAMKPSKPPSAMRDHRTCSER